MVEEREEQQALAAQLATACALLLQLLVPVTGGKQDQLRLLMAALDPMSVSLADETTDVSSFHL